MVQRKGLAMVWLKSPMNASIRCFRCSLEVKLPRRPNRFFADHGLFSLQAADDAVRQSPCGSDQRTTDAPCPYHVFAACERHSRG